MPASSTVDSVIVHVRVPTDVVSQLDAIAEAQGGDFGRLGRSDIIRKLLADGVAAHAPAARTTPPARARAR